MTGTQESQRGMRQPLGAPLATGLAAVSKGGLAPTGVVETTFYFLRVYVYVFYMHVCMRG